MFTSKQSQQMHEIHTLYLVKKKCEGRPGCEARPLLSSALYSDNQFCLPVGQNFSRLGCSSFSFSAEAFDILSVLFLILEVEPSFRILLWEGDTRGEILGDPLGEVFGDLDFLPVGSSSVDFGGLGERMWETSGGGRGGR